MTHGRKPAHKPEAAKPKVDPHYGEIPKGPERYPDSLGKRAGNWLTGLFTKWMQ